MKKQLINITPMQSAKVLAVMYLVLSLPFVMLVMVPMAFSPQAEPPAILLIVMPLLYGAFGFLFTWFAAWVYNHVAAKLGGIEVTFMDV